MFAQSEKKKEIICEDQRSACESHMPTECIVARRASAEMQYITSLSYGQSVTDFATTLEASSNKQVSAAMPARLYYWSPPFVKSPTNVLKAIFWQSKASQKHPGIFAGLWLASQNLLEKVIERIYSHTTFEKDKLTLYSAVIAGILVYSFSSN